MEDILSSIKRIIADGSDRSVAIRGSRRRGANRDEGEPAAGENGDATEVEAQDDDGAILELTDMVEDPAGQASAESATPPRRDRARASAAASPAAPSAAAPAQGGGMLSDISAQAARQSLSQLSSLLVRPSEGEANTLEGLVREMLRPMLKDWLEAQLPDLVESLVKKEIDRIVGRLG